MRTLPYIAASVMFALVAFNAARAPHHIATAIATHSPEVRQ